MSSSSMADANHYTRHQHQQVDQASPNKFYSHFLYKALIVSIFLITLTLFPCQAPEFINQTLNTRGWEFLHLLFVGIAVSYGLFSRRNEETEKENKGGGNNYYSKFDNAQSYVSRLLQVSSVFGDEGDGAAGSSSDEEKFQTFSNQYYRNETVVVVAEENSVLDKEWIGASSIKDEKPLLLPVRRLKSHSFDANIYERVKEPTGASGTFSRSNSNSGSKRVSGHPGKEQEEKLKDQVVLPSPIPWRSGSGRMEFKEEAESLSPAYTPPLSAKDAPDYDNRSIRPQVSRSSSQPNSKNSSPKTSPSPAISSPKKFSPSTSFSLETQVKSAEEFPRKRSFYRSPAAPPPPPPPPPPPATPPQVIRKAMSTKLSHRTVDDDGVHIGKDLKRSFTSEPKDLNRAGGGLPTPKSVGTIRSNNSPSGGWKEKEFEDGIQSKEEMEKNGRNAGGFDQSSVKKNRESFTYIPQPAYAEFPEEDNKELVEKLVVESEEDLETETEEEEEDDIVGSPCVSRAASSSSNEEAGSSGTVDSGPDVDKKADEFIAKFREQIRLQRIESIKRSSAQVKRKASR